jgi:hypothetical protein
MRNFHNIEAAGYRTRGKEYVGYSLGVWFICKRAGKWACYRPGTTVTFYKRTLAEVSAELERRELA